MLLLGVAILCQVPAPAEPDRHTTPLPPEHTPQLLPAGMDYPAAAYNPFQDISAAAKAAGTASRITGAYTAGGAVGIYRNKDSVHYTYSGTRGGDLNGIINFDNASYYRWDTAGNAWRPTYLYILSYDAQNRPNAEVIQTWASSTSSFVNSNKISFSYDVQGRPTLIKNEVWNLGTNAWNNYQQFTSFTYNASGKPASYTLQQWKPSSSSWVNFQRFTGSYSAHGDLTGWVTEIWNAASSAWINMTNERYTYNAAYKNIRYERQTWDAGNNRWKNDLGYSYYYNSSNQNNGYTRQIGDIIGLSWVNTDSFHYSAVNSAGYPLTQLGYVWTSSMWQPATRYTVTYNSANLENYSLREDWNGSSFVNTQRDFSNYNSFGQLSSAYGETYSNGNWGIGITDVSERYAYQNYTTEVSPVALQAADISLCPVPAGQYLDLSIKWQQPQAFSVRVYDMKGSIVQQWDAQPAQLYNRRLSVERTATGVYILRVTSRDGLLEKSFAIQR